MDRRHFVLGLPVFAAACAENVVWAEDEAVATHMYRNPEPASLTLVTIVNTGSGNGAHSAILINAREQVLWDPAGSFEHPRVPERHDVLHGMTPGLVQSYYSYHSRVKYYTITQKLLVAADVADSALRSAQDYGAVPPAGCARSCSRILREQKGFETIRVTWSPIDLMEQFGAFEGVETGAIYEDDEGKSIPIDAANPPTGDLPTEG